MDDEQLNRPVTVIVCKVREFDENGLPEKLDEAIAWLQRLRDEIPPAHRAIATIDIDSTAYWDEPAAWLTVEYTRPPTEDEIAERRATAKREKAAKTRRDRALYQELKKRFGD